MANGQEDFHLFGALSVSDPRECLPQEDEAYMDQVISLLRQFEDTLICSSTYCR